MNTFERNPVKAISQDDYFKTNIILNFSISILSKIDTITDFHDLQNIIKLLRDNISLPFIREILERIRRDIREKTQTQDSNYFDAGENQYNLRYEDENRFNENRTLNLEIKDKIITFLKTNIKQSVEHFKSDSYGKIMDIQKIFKLTDIETMCLIFIYSYDTNSIFASFVNEYCEDGSLRSDNRISKNIFSYALDIHASQVTSLFVQKSNLMKYGIISDGFRIDDEILSYIEGFNTEPLSKKYFKEFVDETLNISDFSFKAEHIDMIQRIISAQSLNGKGFKILFYGKPGTGKTEFARALAKSQNYKTYELNQVNKESRKNHNEDDKFRLQGLFAFENIANDDKTIMIIDEADGFLSSTERGLFGSGTDEMKKGLINNCLDELKHNQIWIINNVSNLDESTKRRFDYSIEFPDLSFNQRKNIWQNILKKSGFGELFNDEELTYFTETYQVNAGLIDKAIENYKRVSGEIPNKEDFKYILHNSLTAHMCLINGKFSTKTNKDPNYKNYSIDGLNIKGNLANYLDILDRFNPLWENGDQSVKNMNVLMWGPPGTGKTELAKYIARRLKRKLIIKTASDILDKYVGGTEENIAIAFKEAEREKAILFIDEIDGLLANRGNSQRTWEVTQVNELLVQMENFNGVLLCATNFFKNVDQAATRRFNIKIEFDYLNESGIEFFYNLYFSDLIKTELAENEIHNLRSIKSLTPGDFKVVYQKTSLFLGDDIKPDFIIDGLKDEAKVKCVTERRIGF